MEYDLWCTRISLIEKQTRIFRVYLQKVPTVNKTGRYNISKCDYVTIAVVSATIYARYNIYELSEIVLQVYSVVRAYRRVVPIKFAALKSEARVP